MFLNEISREFHLQGICNFFFKFNAQRFGYRKTDPFYEQRVSNSIPLLLLKLSSLVF